MKEFEKVNFAIENLPVGRNPKPREKGNEGTGGQSEGKPPLFQFRSQRSAAFY